MSLIDEIGRFQMIGYLRAVIGKAKPRHFILGKSSHPLPSINTPTA